MRIVMASRIFSPEPSAASFMLEGIARAFRDAGHEVIVLTTKPPRHLTAQPIRGVSVSRAPVFRDSSGYVRGYLPYLSFDAPLLFRLLFGKRGDLYFVEPPPTTGAVMRVAAVILRRPYFYDAADIWSDAAKLATASKLVLTMLRRIEIFALRGATHAFAISAEVTARMRELGVATPTTVVAFGVDTDVFHYSVPAAPPATPYFVYAGTYSEWHGADIFIDAFARFDSEHPGHRLVFVGNGSERAELERRTERLGLDEKVDFIEPISGVELSALLGGAVASLASLKPGQGYDYAFTTKIYSSIAAGCPVIFTGVGPTVEFLSHANTVQSAGIAVAYDVDAVADALAQGASHRVSPARREQLSDWARKNYSLDRIAEQIVATATSLTVGR